MTKKERNTNASEPSLAKLIDATLRAVRLQYASDPSGAGIVLAELKDGTFYASVCRYRAPYGQGKEIAARGTGKTAEEAIRAAARAWRGRPQDAESALAALDRVLR